MRFILLLVAAVIAVVVGISVLQYSNKNAVPGVAAPATHADTQSNVATVDVLVARTPIAIGTVIDQSMVDTQPWPEHLVLDSFVVSGGKNDGVVGKVARAAFEPREPFMASKLANPNDPSFLAAALPAGMRAVTMGTDAISGIAGFVFPGDHVDVMFIHNVPVDIRENQDALKDAALPGAARHGAAPSTKPAIAEVLVPNLRVLAVEIRQNGTQQQQAAVSPSSITIEISEADAQKLRLAEKNGTLSLALRSIKDLKDNDVPVPTVLENLTDIRLHNPQEGDTIRIVRGVGKEEDNAAPVMLNGISNVLPSSSPGTRKEPLAGVETVPALNNADIPAAMPDVSR